jgi:ferric-dicitrate binding protein FerR (iron transport regulator)
MNRPEHYDELTRLLSGLLDGRLSDEEFARLEQWLRRDPAARRLYMQYADMEVEFTTLSGTPARLPAAPRPVSRRRRLFVAAAAVLVAVVATACWFRFGKPTADGDVLPVVTGLGGEVRIVSADGRARPAADGERLQPGDTVRLEGEHDRTQLTFPDGARLALSGKTSLVVTDARAKSVSLAEGELYADVPPQPQGQGWTVASPHAEVRVVGTRFALRVGEGGTEVTVTEGVVSATRIGDGKSVEVSAGNRLLVREGVSLLTQPLADPPLVWLADFEDGLPKQWTAGEFVTRDLPPGSRGGVRAVRAPMPDAENKRPWIVAARQEGKGGLFTLPEDAHLLLRFRVSHATPIRIGVVARSRVGEPESPFALELSDPVQTDPWHEATIPLSLFRPALPPGSVISLLSLGTGESDAGLVLDRVGVTRGGPGRLTVRPLD